MKLSGEIERYSARSTTEAIDYPAMRPEARQIRDRCSELRKLINGWDPLGVVAFGAPADEYDCVSGPLLRRLEERASAAEIADYLTTEFSDHFGVQVTDAVAFAERAIAWHKELTSTAG